jgi:hypothetical protein
MGPDPPRSGSIQRNSDLLVYPDRFARGNIVADGQSPYGAAPRGFRPDPGTRWVNPTSTTWYQLLSSLRRPCRACIVRHGAVSPRPWDIPFHPHCECAQLAVPPGKTAPIDGRTPAGVVRQITTGGQEQLLDVDTVRIIQAGLVTLEDAVGADDWRILDFAALVAAHGLTRAQLEDAGVPSWEADRVLGAAGTAAVETATPPADK